MNKEELRSIVKGMKPLYVVEAALFSAGRPLAIEEIVEATGLSAQACRKAMEQLQKEYAGRDTVLEVGKAGSKWAMQVRAKAAEPAARFAPMEIPTKLLKTLALIAYHQPMKQSELADMVGSKVYEHVHELSERGLVRGRKDGQTKLLSTTPLFPEYFGLDATNPDEVRRVMGKLVGIEAPPKRKEGQTTLAGPRAEEEPGAEAAEPEGMDAAEKETAQSAAPPPA